MTTTATLAVIGGITLILTDAARIPAALAEFLRACILVAVAARELSTALAHTPSTPREAGNPNAAQCCLRSRLGGVERVVEQVARLTYQELLQSRQQPAARSSSCDPSPATLVRTHTWRMRPRESQVAGNG